jgi:hypothetical protein
MNGRSNQSGSWRAWWRDRVPFEQKAALAVLCLGGLLVAGWLGADSLSSASAGVRRTTAPMIETVDRVVTVREIGPDVTTRVPEVKRVLVPEVKRVFVTRKETTPGVTVVRTETAYGTSTVRVPTYVTHVVTAPARTVTQVVTDVATTVEWRVITVVEKSKPVTVTVTASTP